MSKEPGGAADCGRSIVASLQAERRESSTVREKSGAEVEQTCTLHASWLRHLHLVARSQGWWKFWGLRRDFPLSLSLSAPAPRPTRLRSPLPTRGSARRESVAVLAPPAATRTRHPSCRSESSEHGWRSKRQTAKGWRACEKRRRAWAGRERRGKGAARASEARSTCRTAATLWKHAHSRDDATTCGAKAGERQRERAKAERLGEARAVRGWACERRACRASHARISPARRRFSPPADMHSASTSRLRSEKRKPAREW